MSTPLVYENHKYQVYSDEHNGLYLRHKHPNYATVVALNAGKLVVIAQYRKAIDSISYELPGGKIDEGESYEQAARRELLEETGLVCGELHFLGTANSYACLVDSRTHLFFTRDILEQREQNLDADESISVEFHEVEAVFAAIENGTWCDPELSHGILLARLKGMI